MNEKEIRKLEVDGRNYSWTFKEKVIVVDEGFDNSLLVVDFGKHDEWLYVNDNEKQPHDFEPTPVNPKFVGQSIKFARDNGWNGGKMDLEFKGGHYKVRE